MLKAVHLSKRYNANHVALNSLNLTVAPGDIFCLLGANGAGKTTTINLFLGFLDPTSGAAYVKDLEVAKKPMETKRYLAYIPEQVSLYRNLTGLENLRYFSALAGHSDYSQKELLALLADAGLSEEAALRRVGGYSKGMRQKVGIAVALAKRAEALLLDEPTSGLDPQASNEFSGLLARLASQRVAILMATHDLFRVKEVGSHVGIMRQGNLLTTFRTDAVSHSELERSYLEYMHT